MPPLALISLAAIWAPPGVAAPAIDCTSAITPILMGSPDWAWAGPARLRANVAANGIRRLWLRTRLETGNGRCTIFSPDIVCFVVVVLARRRTPKSMVPFRQLGRHFRGNGGGG